MAQVFDTAEAAIAQLDGTETYDEAEFALRDFSSKELAVNAAKLVVGVEAGAASSDIVSFTPAGTIAATNVQDALEELDDDIQGISASEAALTWNAVSWQAGWANFGSGYGDVEYAKDAAKALLYFRGVGNPPDVSPTHAFTLPAGFRPAAKRLVHMRSDTTTGAADVNTDGTFVFFAAGSSSVCFDGVMCSL
jgi:hypothetical protein